jgi:hypothetical protein
MPARRASVRGGTMLAIRPFSIKRSRGEVRWAANPSNTATFWMTIGGGSPADRSTSGGSDRPQLATSRVARHAPTTAESRGAEVVAAGRLRVTRVVLIPIMREAAL